MYSIQIFVCLPFHVSLFVFSKKTYPHHTDYARYWIIYCSSSNSSTGMTHEQRTQHSTLIIIIIISLFDECTVIMIESFRFLFLPLFQKSVPYIRRPCVNNIDKIPATKTRRWAPCALAIIRRFFFSQRSFYRCKTIDAMYVNVSASLIN